MKYKKLFLIFPLLMVFGLASCDGETVGAQDLGADSPAANTAMTKAAGKVVPPGDESCNGMFPGFMEGDDVEIAMASDGGMSGTGSVMVNGGSDGSITCSADGSGLEIIDSPPVSNIICAVTSVSTQFTGVNVGDLITMVINFSGETPVQKQAAVTHLDSCIIIGIENLNADS